MLRALRPALATLLVALPLASCETRPQGAELVIAGAGDTEELQEYVRKREHARRAFERESDRFEAASTDGRLFELGDRGRLRVHRIELLGGPESPYLRARFTWENSTDGNLPIPTVSLFSLTPGGRERSRAELELLRTLDRSVAPGAAHTAWLDLDIGDLYLVPGWDWGMDVRVGTRD
ncbi:MAG: hypothetical protein AAFR54_17120 [Planctomycetota bacterium]